MPIQRPATTMATGRRMRHIAAADQSCRASSFAVAAMIRSARAFEASRLAVIVAEASPATCSTAFSTRSSVRFSIRWTAPPTWLTSVWFAVTCVFRPSIAEAAPLHEQYPTQMNPGTPLPILPHSPGLRSRIWYGAATNASAIQAARDGVNLMSSTLVFEHGDKPFGDIQADQLRAYRRAWREAGHDWTPRVSVSRSIFPLLSERDRGLYGLSASGDQVGHLDSGVATFGRTYAADPSTLIKQLSQDRALAEADTLLLTIPNQLGFEKNWSIIRNFADYVAPALGWELPVRVSSRRATTSTRPWLSNGERERSGCLSVRSRGLHKRDVTKRQRS